jgi:hypothetical protein
MGCADRRPYLAWTRAAGPFWQYVSAMPFYRYSPRRPVRGPLAAGRRIAQESVLPLIAPGTGRSALYLDVPISLALATTLTFQDAGWLVVPAVYRWPAERPLLPVDAVSAQLTWLSVRLLRPPKDPRGVVFLLDAERSRPSGSIGGRRCFDNRYAYPADVFPPGNKLRSWGVETVVLAADYEDVPEDVSYVTQLLAKSGLPVSRVWVPVP